PDLACPDLHLRRISAVWLMRGDRVVIGADYADVRAGLAEDGRFVLAHCREPVCQVRAGKGDVAIGVFLALYPHQLEIPAAAVARLIDDPCGDSGYRWVEVTHASLLRRARPARLPRSGPSFRRYRALEQALPWPTVPGSRRSRSIALLLRRGGRIASGRLPASREAAARRRSAARRRRTRPGWRCREGLRAAPDRRGRGQVPSPSAKG